MNISINPLPDNSPNIKQSGKLAKTSTENSISFSSQLTGMVNERKKTDKNNNINDNITGYSPLKDTQNASINSLLNKNSIVNEKSAEKVFDLLDKTRSQLMSGIKKSIQKIETSINENQNIDSELKDKYVKLISTLKDDFSSGFGVEYKTFNPGTSENIDSLFNDIQEELKILPPAIRKVIEDNIT